MTESLPSTIAVGLPSWEGELVFGSPHWLWLLFPLCALFFLNRRAGSPGVVLHPTVRFIADLLEKPGMLAGRLGPVLLTLAALFLTLALARPQLRNEHRTQDVSGVDIMIACDLSGSMTENRDMLVEQQTPAGRRRLLINRLHAAKLVIDQFVERRPNDRIGLIAFAGKTKTCCPLTLDHNIVRRIVNGFNADYLQSDGTAVGSAIAAAASRLESCKDSNSRIIILVTDGASNAGSLPPIEAAKAAAALGIRIYTIAIGTENNQISQYTANVDFFDEKTLKEIARITGGEHYRARNSRLLDSAFKTIDKLEKTEVKQRSIVYHEQLFIYPLGLAAALLLFGLTLPLVLPKPAP